MKLRYVDVSIHLEGKDRVGNRVTMPLQTEQTIEGFWSYKSGKYGTLVCGSNKFHNVCLDSFLPEEDEAHPVGQSG